MNRLSSTHLLRVTLTGALLGVSLACASPPKPQPPPPPQPEPVSMPMERSALVAEEADEEGQRLERAAQDYRRHLEQMFAELQQELDACYLPQLKRDPSLKGAIVVEFQVVSGGVISEGPRVSASSINNKKVEACLLELIKAQRYPEPFNGDHTDVKRRFEFGAF